jgi:hypothetical protein
MFCKGLAGPERNLPRAERIGSFVIRRRRENAWRKTVGNRRGGVLPLPHAIALADAPKRPNKPGIMVVSTERPFTSS